LKLLFLANRIPYPPYRGDKLKIYNLARRLQDRHELHLLTFVQDKNDFEHKAELEKIFKEVHLVYLPRWRSAVNCIPGLVSKAPLQVNYFYSAALKAKLFHLLRQHSYDAVHVQHLRMSPYLASRKDIPRILDLPDAFSLYWERRKSIRRNPALAVFENMEQARLLKYERIIDQYDLSLVCSEEDRQYLIKTHGNEHIKLLPNGVDCQTFAPRDHDYSRNDTILFTGNMDYAPNIDAVVYFTGEVLPMIRVRHPQVQFVIAGQKPVPKVLELASEQVQVTGFVKDLAGKYNEASVVVAPLRFGAGTQNKVLEAMAMGVPVVCSNIGFAGLGIQSGQGAIMQTDPSAFAQSVCDLLDSEKKREEVGQCGIQIIKTRFDWDVVALQLEGYFRDVVARTKH
jgi:polysaccharide biosynthesis protein PslH